MLSLFILSICVVVGIFLSKKYKLFDKMTKSLPDVSLTFGSLVFAGTLGIVFLIITIIGFSITSNGFYRISIVLGAIGITFHMTSLFIYKVEPGTAAMLIRLGAPMKEALPVGYHLVIPFVDEIALLDDSTLQLEIKTDGIFMPKDNVELKFPFSSLVKPDRKNIFNLYSLLIQESRESKSKSGLLSIKDSAEIPKQLQKMFTEACVSLAGDKGTEPYSFESARYMGYKFIRWVILKIKERGDEIPKDENGNHKSWDDMTPEEREFKIEVEELEKRLYNGNDELPIPGLGIKIVKLNLGEIEPTKEVKEAIEEQIIEIAQQKKELIEAETISKLILTKLRTLGYTEEEIRAIVSSGETTPEKLWQNFRIEREKASEVVHSFNFDGIGSSLLAGILSQLTKAGGING